MPKIILNEPGVCALVGQGKAARVAEPVRVRVHGQSCARTRGTDRQPGGLPAERATPLTHTKRPRLRFHSRPRSPPCLDRPECVTPERVRGGQAVFAPRNMQPAAVDVPLGQPQPAGLRHAQAVTEHQQE